MFEGWGAAVVGAAVVGGVAKGVAANKASKAQGKSAQAGIDAENQRFEEATKLLQPYTDAGVDSLSSQRDLIGLNGGDAQQRSIAAIRNSPEFNYLTQQGEESILQNASATGGLRGGNTQSALEEFRPQLLSQLINQRFQQLGGITQLGQASAAKVGANGMQNGQDVANLLGVQGQAQAGKYLAYGSAVNGVANSIGGVAMAGGKVF